MSLLLAEADMARMPVEGVPLAQAAARVLASDVIAPMPLPNFDNAAMDGFALGEPGDDPLQWTLVGSQFAGGSALPALERGQSARITTGALLPPGARAVAMREETTVEGNWLRLARPHGVGEHIRREGEDVRAGDVVMTAGIRLAASQVGLAAALGLPSLPCHRRPTVAVFSSGDELVPPGQPLAPGHIHDSNRYQLLSLLRGEGLEPVAWPVLPDDEARIASAIGDASEAFDLILTCGGVSAGEKDFLPGLLARHGQVRFWKVRIKPGMPVLFGRWGRALLLSLPGNPVSVLATWHAFARPLLAAMQGDRLGPPRWKARTNAELVKSHARLELLRATWSISDEGEIRVDADPVTGSNRLRSASRANCLLKLGEGPQRIEAGGIVEIWPI